MARVPLIVVAFVCLAAGRAPQPDRVVIPAGAFTQGSTRGEEDERPARKVTLKAFAINRTEVTQGDYAACVAAIRRADTRAPRGRGSRLDDLRRELAAREAEITSSETLLESNRARSSGASYGSARPRRRCPTAS